MARNLQAYTRQVRDLDQKEIIRQDLMRDFKAQEANYFLYQRKEEEARISDALNRSRIVNVALVEAASVPNQGTPAVARADAGAGLPGGAFCECRRGGGGRVSESPDSRTGQPVRTSRRAGSWLLYTARAFWR